MQFAKQSVSSLRAIKTKAMPRSLARVPLDRLIVSLERLRLQGGKEEAIQIGRTAVRNLPGSGKAHRFLVRSLLTEPVETHHLVEARAVAEAMIALWDDPAVSDQYVSVLIAQHHAGLDEPRLVDAAALFFQGFPQRRLSSFRRLLNYLIDSNDIERVLQLCDEVGTRVTTADSAALIHEILLRCEQPERAEALELQIADEEWAQGEVVALLTAARLASSGLGMDALTLLQAQKPQRTRQFSAAYCDRLAALGLPAKLLEFLDSNVHNLSETKEMGYRFDSLWLLGRTEEAKELLDAAAKDGIQDLQVLRRLLIAHHSPAEVARLHDDDLDETRRPGDRTPAELETLTGIWFELNQIDELIAIESHRREVAALGTLGKYNLGRAHYVRRDFDRANLYFDQLRQTTRHWESAKLQSRMLLEEGRYEEALALRDEYPRVSDPIDEVRFFGLLHLKRFDEAFETYLDANDRRRLAQSFGDCAEFDTFEHVSDRFVIAQNGPGDDIQTFATLAPLAERTQHLTATCDPRLHSLLSRSLPDVTFLPVERLGGRIQAGLLHPDRPERAEGELFDVLTAEAAKVAHAASRVVFSRSIPQLTAETGAPRPYPPYLRPLDSLVNENSTRFADLETPTGLVWRSEIAGPMRDIHYLSVEAMQPFAALDRDFVCLQHDTTESERERLADYFGNRITFLDDVDLRDDFEATAAVIASCAAVVGVVTTSVELAAAVGTPTIMLQPNKFGAWRAQDNDRDYWHAAARHACSNDYRASMECVERAVAMLRDD